jgi:nucleoside 2-deoxyribosyltransferase
MQIYLAASLFTQAERRWLRELALALRAAGHGVFLPQDDAAAPLLRTPPDFASTFELCVQGIEEADVVVAVLDGPDGDSGTAWECGYAYARSKPLLGVRTDLRAGSEDDGMNLMLRRSVSAVVRTSSEDLGALARELVAALRSLES